MVQATHQEVNPAQIRTVRQYAEQHCVSAAFGYRERPADEGAAGRQLVDWLRALEQKWTALRFGEVKVEVKGTQILFEV